MRSALNMLLMFCHLKCPSVTFTIVQIEKEMLLCILKRQVMLHSIIVCSNMDRKQIKRRFVLIFSLLNLLTII